MLRIENSIRYISLQPRSQGLLLSGKGRRETLTTRLISLILLKDNVNCSRVEQIAANLSFPSFNRAVFK